MPFKSGRRKGGAPKGGDFPPHAPRVTEWLLKHGLKDVIASHATYSTFHCDILAPACPHILLAPEDGGRFETAAAKNAQAEGELPEREGAGADLMLDKGRFVSIGLCVRTMRTTQWHMIVSFETCF